MYKGKRIGVVVPAYNEELLVGEVIRTMPEYVDSIYVIDDCSTDNTSMVVNSFNSPRVLLTRHDTNKGVGGAIVTGYKLALRDNMNLVAVMAGDNQMDPKQLVRLLDPVIVGVTDYSKGNRLSDNGHKKGMSRWRRFGNFLLSILTKISSGCWHVQDPQNGYTVISEEALKMLDLDKIFTYYGYCNDILAKLKVLHLRVHEVNMPARYGLEKSKIRYGIYIRKVSFLLLRNLLWRLGASVTNRFVKNKPSLDISKDMLQCLGKVSNCAGRTLPFPVARAGDLRNLAGEGGRDSLSP